MPAASLADGAASRGRPPSIRAPGGGAAEAPGSGRRGERTAAAPPRPPAWAKRHARRAWRAPCLPAWWTAAPGKSRRRPPRSRAARPCPGAEHLLRGPPRLTWRPHDAPPLAPARLPAATCAPRPRLRAPGPRAAAAHPEGRRSPPPRARLASRCTPADAPCLAPARPRPYLCPPVHVTCCRDPGPLAGAGFTSLRPRTPSRGRSALSGRRWLARAGRSPRCAPLADSLENKRGKGSILSNKVWIWGSLCVAEFVFSLPLFTLWSRVFLPMLLRRAEGTSETLLHLVARAWPGGAARPRARPASSGAAAGGPESSRFQISRHGMLRVFVRKSPTARSPWP